jgi:LexA DNA binding domain
MEPEPALSPRQRQILDFVASYVADEGFLPTTREIAMGCGLQSPTSVRRALHALEAAGYIERDPVHTRLATVRTPGELAPGADLDEELFVCQAIVIEMEAAVETARRGLAWAPDLDAQELVHREALARIRLCRVYGDVRTRMERQGARLQPGSDDALERLRRLVSRRHELITSWDSYCLSALVLRVAVSDFVAQPLSLGQHHLRPAYAAELDLLDLEDRPDLRAVRDRLVAGDPALHALLAEHVAALRDTFQELAAHSPALAATELGAVVDEVLDNALHRLPTA